MLTHSDIAWYNIWRLMHKNMHAIYPSNKGWRARKTHLRKECSMKTIVTQNMEEISLWASLYSKSTLLDKKRGLLLEEGFNRYYGTTIEGQYIGVAKELWRATVHSDKHYADFWDMRIGCPYVEREKRRYEDPSDYGSSHDDNGKYIPEEDRWQYNNWFNKVLIKRNFEERETSTGKEKRLEREFGKSLSDQGIQVQYQVPCKHGIADIAIAESLGVKVIVLDDKEYTKTQSQKVIDMTIGRTPERMVPVTSLSHTICAVGLVFDERDWSIAHRLMICLKQMEDMGLIFLGIVKSDEETPDDITGYGIALPLISNNLLKNPEKRELAFCCDGCGQLIIPIILEDCAWKEMPEMQGELGVYPSNKIPISEQKEEVVFQDIFYSLLEFVTVTPEYLW